MNILSFRAAIAQQFTALSSHRLLRAAVDKDKLWEIYLDSFPPGTNEIFRTRREYDCSCCKQFVRQVGDVVAVVNGQLATIWDLPENVDVDFGFRQVAAALALYVRAAGVGDYYLSDQPVAGTDRSLERLADQQVRQWDHLFVNIPRSYLRSATQASAELGALRTNKDCLKTGLRTITADAVETVLDLIGQDSIYRGAEFLHAVQKFQEVQKRYLLAPNQELYCWTEAAQQPHYITHMHNTSIGQLLVDLSNGVDLDRAMYSYERKVAPQNYRRTTALVTPAMIEAAKAKVEELGLSSALDRRFATLRDISVNQILFADRSARPSLRGGAFDDLAAEVGKRGQVSDRVEDVPVERFLTEILPRCQSLEVLFENRLVGNLVSLVTAVDPSAGRLFKWDNPFSWAYRGDAADSIKERVKAAGGNVTGELCCRLAWNNRDDLDLHLVGPGGDHVYYTNRRRLSPNGAMLDVDANGIDGLRDDPVENIFFETLAKARSGDYRLYVHQFSKRSTKNPGFEAEIDLRGEVTRFSFPQALRDGQTVDIARISIRDGVVAILPSKDMKDAQVAQPSQTVWGLPTQSWHRCNLVLQSPNYWQQPGVGNRHLMFMLEGCRNDGSARGFFNEFLASGLEPHRKVFELLGARMKLADTPDQLSGLGFSSTRREKLSCRVKGGFTRTINVVF